MKTIEIENKILELVKNDQKYTMFALRQEFKPRHHSDFRKVLADLIQSKKICFDESQFLKLGEK